MLDPAWKPPGGLFWRLGSEHRARCGHVGRARPVWAPAWEQGGAAGLRPACREASARSRCVLSSLGSGGLPGSPARQCFPQTLLSVPSLESALPGALPFSSAPTRWAARLTFQPGRGVRGPSPASGGATGRHFASEKGRASACPSPNCSVSRAASPLTGECLTGTLRSPEEGNPSHFLPLRAEPLLDACERFVRVREPIREPPCAWKAQVIGLWGQSPTETGVPREGRLPRTHGASARGLAARRAGA